MNSLNEMIPLWKKLKVSKYEAVLYILFSFKSEKMGTKKITFIVKTKKMYIFALLFEVFYSLNLVLVSYKHLRCVRDMFLFSAEFHPYLCHNEVRTTLLT